MIVPQNDVAKLCILFVIDENWVIHFTPRPSTTTTVSVRWLEKSCVGCVENILLSARNDYFRRGTIKMMIAPLSVGDTTTIWYYIYLIYHSDRRVWEFGHSWKLEVFPAAPNAQLPRHLRLPRATKREEWYLTQRDGTAGLIRSIW